MIVRSTGRIILPALFALLGAFTGASAQCTFENPIMEGADPFVTFHGGKYYVLVTRADRITIRSAEKLQEVAGRKEILAWQFKDTPVGGHVWAPEMYFMDGNWYIYSCGQNTGLDMNPESVPYVQEDQQMFVLQSMTGDPFGPYEFDSWLMPGTGAIDETIFTHSDGKRYIIWSQFNLPGQPQSQCLYIAELLSPSSVGTRRVLISCPDQPWELHGWPVNEGPAVLQRGGLTYIVYSGSGYLTPEYALGYLVNSDGDLLNPGSWTKVGPVFQQNPEGGLYATGHNSFTTSPDGTQDWIVYHARLSPDGNTSRYMCMQEFTWEEDVPQFSEPFPAGQAIVCPSDTGWTVSLRSGERDPMVVFPNPAEEFLKIGLPAGFENVSLKIRNLAGQTMLAGEMGEGELNISQLPEGFYVINISSGRFSFYKGFLKL